MPRRSARSVAAAAGPFTLPTVEILEAHEPFGDFLVQLLFLWARQEEGQQRKMQQWTGLAGPNLLGCPPVHIKPNLEVQQRGGADPMTLWETDRAGS